MSAGRLPGSNCVKQFNHTNHIDVIARAHQLVMEGYKYMFDKQLVTVWSALQSRRATSTAGGLYRVCKMRSCDCGFAKEDRIEQGVRV
jgi:hypothetical protein